jgi:hypothetical protein
VNEKQQPGGESMNESTVLANSYYFY